MRSWVLTILGALLAWLLWTTAQRIRKEGFSLADTPAGAFMKAQAEGKAAAPPAFKFSQPGPTETQEAFTKKLNEFNDEMKKKSKTMQPADLELLNKSIEAAAKQGHYESAGTMLDGFAAKYLASGDRLDVLTNLITDARSRIASIEAQTEEAKKKGKEAEDKAKALSNPETLPPVDENAKPEPVPA